jgi:hypothetical protein
MPNLAQRAGLASETSLETLGVGAEQIAQSSCTNGRRENVWLTTGFGIASGIYRLFVSSALFFSSWRISS